MRLLLLSLLVRLSTADEYWFVFEQQRFPGFYTPLVTLMSQQHNLSFALSAHEHSIDVSVDQNKRPVQLNIERADLLSNTFHQLIFVALRQKMKLESYVNCKLTDSYLLYSVNLNDDNSSFVLQNLAEDIEHVHLKGKEHDQRQLFERFGCKQAGAGDNKTTAIGRPLIRKMQQIIEKAQQRKQRSRDQSDRQSPIALTIVYKPNLDQYDTQLPVILNASQLQFHVRYDRQERCFHVQFHNENRTEVILYADKSADLLQPHNASQEWSTTTVLFLRIIPTMITCYVNCEVTDQELISDSVYLQSIIEQMMSSEHRGTKSILDYDRQSTLMLFNRSMDQIAADFLCSKLDEKNNDLLPEQHALRKFANVLDILVDSVETSVDTVNQTSTVSTQNVSAVDIHSINGFGSLKAPSFDPLPNEMVVYDRLCLTDQDCSSTNASLQCQNERCTCPVRSFWSTKRQRCLVCRDVSIGHRCFRFSNHKSTWNEANDFCHDETSLDEQQEYSMRLTSNLNGTDIELLKQSLLQEEDGEPLDYFYWIGATSQVVGARQLNNRTKRRVATASFQWYDSEAITQLDIPNLWCLQREQANSDATGHTPLCVSLTSCGLYADACQRNYRFLCEAV